MSEVSGKKVAWMTLFDLFVDNEISYEYIVKRVAHLPISEVERILF